MNARRRKKAYKKLAGLVPQFRAMVRDAEEQRDRRMEAMLARAYHLAEKVAPSEKNS